LNLSFYISKRYLISKKSHNIINIISAISLVGVLVGTMSLIIVLSVFNGLESLVIKYYNSFNSDFVIQAKEGKVFSEKTFPFEKINKINGVASTIKIIDDIALLMYDEKQFIAHLKGVDDNFGKYNRFDSLVIDGKFKLHSGNLNYIIPGAGVASRLGINLVAYKSVKAFYPNRTATNLSDPLNSLNTGELVPSGVFSSQTDSDIEYAIVPLKFMREITGYNDELTSVEISILPKSNIDAIQDEITKILDSSFTIKNRFQQEEMLYKVMEMEKIAILIILSFILLLATFNIIGTLSMLIIEKKKDISILISLGANKSLIERIFLFEGILINMFGGFLGLILGSILCFIQQQFGIIKIGAENANYALTVYPVEMRFSNFLLVFGIATILGFISTWIPVKRLTYLHYSGKIF